MLRNFAFVMSCVFVLLVLAACGSTSLASAPPTGFPPAEAPESSTPSAENETGFPVLKSGAPLVQSKDTGLPSFSHIYTIIMENREYDSVVGSQNAPFINSLIGEYGSATNYTAVAHPSEPNYFALFSGSTQGAAGDGIYNLSGQNLADQIQAAGKTWRVFAENYPGGCFKGAVASGGQDAPGTYARKHNPAISFTDITNSPERCANITDLSHFDAGAANYELIVPNLCNDMHDCSSGAGDNFLRQFVPKILASGAWQNGGVLFVVWDEGGSTLGGGGRVALLVISKEVTKGFQSAARYNHYSLVRTIEDAWGLPCLNLACQANNLSAFFH